MKTSPRRKPRSRFLLQVEQLEARLAFASRIDDFTVTYQDVDGDNVTVLSSLPIFTPGNVNAILKFDQGSVNGNNTLPQQLQQVNVSGLPSGSVNGVSLTISAAQNPGGDGLVNVGYIDGSGKNLGNIVVEGDLGAITTGDGTVSAGELASLTVNSLGTLGLTTQGDVGTMLTRVPYAWGSMNVLGDVGDVRVIGGEFGSITIGGTVAGVVLGTVFCANIETIRQWLSALTGTELFSPEIYFLSQIPAEMDPVEVAMVVAMWRSTVD